MPTPVTVVAEVTIPQAAMVMILHIKAEVPVGNVKGHVMANTGVHVPLAVLNCAMVNVLK